MKTNQNSLNQLLTPLTFLLVFFLLSRTPIDADLWWHLRVGQVMWEKGGILLKDIFSYTQAGKPWVNAFWLSELLLYSLQRFGGYFALAMFVSLSGALTFHFVSRRMNGNLIVNSFIIILAAITAAPIWGPRPQVLSFLLVALLDLWLSRSPRWKWLLLPIFALWANLHGGWIWGFLLLIAHITGLFVKSFAVSSEEGIGLRRECVSLFGWTALAALAIGLNPNGIAIWKLPFEQVNVSLQIQEWLSPDFHRMDFHPMLWMLFLLILTAPFAPKLLDWPQLFKVLGFAYLTFLAQRNIALFAIVASPLLADWGNAVLQTIGQRQSRIASPPKLNPRLVGILNAAILLIFAVVALGNLFLITQPERVDENYPVAAVKWIQTHQPAGRLFNSYNWGGYLLWTLPEYPVFIDGRADLYGSDLIQQWQDVVNAEDNALSILDRWQVNVILVEPYWNIVDVLKGQGWSIVFEDEKAVIFLKGKP
jgi:hypothetical protein